MLRCRAEATYFSNWVWLKIGIGREGWGVQATQKLEEVRQVFSYVYSSSAGILLIGDQIGRAL